MTRKPTTKPALSSPQPRVLAPTPVPITYGRHKDGTLKVFAAGRHSGELRPSKQFPGKYYAEVFTEKGYMAVEHGWRTPVELPTLKKQVETFLSKS